MGYSLYWNYRKPEKDEKLSTSFSPKFIAKVKDAIKVASKAGIKLGDWDGSQPKTEPITNTTISFNGNGPGHCETFTLTAVAPQSFWDCCKTNYKEYTILCMEILQLAVEKNILADWSSDGNDQDLKEKWNKLYKRNSNEETSAEQTEI